MLDFAMLSLPARFRQIISQGLLLGSLLTPCGICGITIPFCNRAPLVGLRFPHGTLNGSIVIFPLWVS
jgi:hypothetical protein